MLETCRALQSCGIFPFPLFPSLIYVRPDLFCVYRRLLYSITVSILFHILLRVRSDFYFCLRVRS